MFLAKLFMPLLDDAKNTDQTNNTPCISFSNGIKLKNHQNRPDFELRNRTS
jgi:hypothetical protein